MMEEFVLKAIDAGSSAVLALVIFYFYRQDRKDSIAAYGRITERFEELGKDFKEIVKDNTKAVLGLASAIERQK